MKKPQSLRSEQAQSLVETALLLPVLLMILVGIVDIGRAYYSYIQLTNAAREGARYAVSHPTDNPGAKQAAVNAATSSGVPISLGDVTITGGTVSGDTKTVTIKINFQLVSFYIFRAGAIPLQNSASMVVLPS